MKMTEIVWKKKRWSYVTYLQGCVEMNERHVCDRYITVRNCRKKLVSVTVTLNRMMMLRFDCLFTFIDFITTYLSYVYFSFYIA